MDLFSLLSYLNKISLIAFFLTACALFYQFYLLKKENTKKEIPIIPDFYVRTAIPQPKKIIPYYTPLPRRLFKKRNFVFNWQRFILIILFLITALTFLLIYIIMEKRPRPAPTNKSGNIVKEVVSQGIRIYDKEWNELTESEIKLLKSGDSIIVGLSSVDDDTIDKARIRINSDDWQESDSLLNFDSKNKVFYRYFTINDSQRGLKIEAQFHSSKYGWLTD